jgi:energy-coupling factor transport system permease protein
VRRAYDLAEAMECRCYNGGVGKQRMKQLHLRFSDFFALLICLIWGALIILIKVFLG